MTQDKQAPPFVKPVRAKVAGDPKYAYIIDILKSGSMGTTKKFASSEDYRDILPYSWVYVGEEVGVVSPERKLTKEDKIVVVFDDNSSGEFNVWDLKVIDFDTSDGKRHLPALYNPKIVSTRTWIEKILIKKNGVVHGVEVYGEIASKLLVVSKKIDIDEKVDADMQELSSNGDVLGAFLVMVDWIDEVYKFDPETITQIVGEM